METHNNTTAETIDQNITMEQPKLFDVCHVFI